MTSARRLAAGIADGSLSAVEVMEQHLARIAEVNPRLNAIVTLDEEGARAQARAADEAVARGDALGPLHGLPIAVKDIEDTAGMRTTYGSTIFADHVPDADGMLAERLRRAGAIIIGKTNTPEFAAGSNTFNRVFGATLNPHDASLTPGGSSGGAAVAVATGMLPFADGSDLASSIRNPASFCGVVGLRPSPGRIPAADPESDPWQSLAVFGPIARSVDDAALLLGALAGRDGRDPKSVAAPPDALDPVVPASLDGLRVAWSRNLGDLPVASAVTALLEPRRDQLAALGAHVTDAEPDLRAADFVFDTLRAVGFASFAPLLEAHEGELKEAIVWNVRKGLALTGGEIAARVRGPRRRLRVDRDVPARLRRPRPPHRPGAPVPGRAGVGRGDRRRRDGALRRVAAQLLADHGHRPPRDLDPRRVDGHRSPGRAPARRAPPRGAAAAGGRRGVRGRV